MHASAQKIKEGRQGMEQCKVNDKNSSTSLIVEDKFPEGLRVLAVDDNITSLKLIEKLLHICRYEVTIATETAIALRLLKENKSNFDIVITDVHMQDNCDGFKILEIIGLEMDIPVVMVSADDNKKTVMKAVEYGACDYLVKPVRLQVIKNIWQHVARKSKCELNGSSTVKERKHAKRERQDLNEEATYTDDGRGQKKQRFNWTHEKHAKFIAIVHEFGADNAVPSKILEKMDIDGLTREQVASHLQKYKNGLKKSRSDEDGSTTMLSFNNQGCSLVSRYNGSKFNDCSKEGVNQFLPSVLKSESFSSPSSYYINHTNSLPRSYPQALQTLHHINQIQFPEFGGMMSDSIKMENQLCNNGFMYQAFPLKIIPNSNNNLFSARSWNPPPNGYLASDLLPFESNVTTHNNSLQVVGNSFPGQSDRSIILNHEMQSFIDICMPSDHIVMEDHLVDQLETENILQCSSSNPLDDDPNAIFKQAYDV